MESLSAFTKSTFSQRGGNCEEAGLEGRGTTCAAPDALFGAAAEFLLPRLETPLLSSFCMGRLGGNGVEGGRKGEGG